MTVRRVARFWGGIAVAVFFLWLIIRQIEFSQVKNAFVGARTIFLVLAVASFFVGYSCRIERWRVMLKQDNPGLRWRQCAGPLIASFAANNVLPFRAGDFLRVFGFNRRLGISTATSLTTLLVERLLDLLMVVSFLGIALAYFNLDSSRLIGLSSAILLACGALILFLLLFPTPFKFMTFSIASQIDKFLPTFGKKLNSELGKVFAALEHMSQWSTIVKLLFWSVLAWLAEGFVFWIAALALPSLANHMAAWLALSVGTLATIIPGTPGYVGTFDYFTVRSMTALGNSVSAATAYAFLVHAVLWLPPTICGGLYLLLSPVKNSGKSKLVTQ